MSVYTSLSLDETTAFLTRYGLGAVQQLEGITAGVVNTNYRIKAGQGEYILTLVENPEDGRNLPYLIDLLNHLALQHLPVPLPVADRQGIFLHELQGRPALMVTFLPGESPLHPSPAACQQVGEMLARLHRAGNHFPTLRENPMGASRWNWLLQRLTPHLAERDPATLSLLQAELALRREDWADVVLPTGLCHADLFPDNTLFHHERLTGVLDFHYACHERWIYDLAITLNAWCFNADGHPEAECFRALWAGYAAIRHPQPIEQQLLRTALRAASLRFALTRLYARYFPRLGSAVTRKPPEEYLDRLRFHQQHEIAELYRM